MKTIKAKKQTLSDVESIEELNQLREKLDIFKELAEHKVYYELTDKERQWIREINKLIKGIEEEEEKHKKEEKDSRVQQ